MPSPVNAEEQTTLPNLFFSEIKVRYDSTNSEDYDEYIELYNNSPEIVLLSEYTLEYFNITNPLITQIPVTRSISEKQLPSQENLTLAKTQSQISNSLPMPFTSLNDTGGRLRLVDSEGTIVDEIAWSNVSSQATQPGVTPTIVFQCTNSAASCISRSQSIGRLIVDNTYGNLWELGQPDPRSAVLVGNQGLDTDEEILVTPEMPSDPTQPDITCEGIVLTEVLPNPSGSDIGKEFIEVFNPSNDYISLKGCALQTSGSAKKYFFGDVSLQPGAYHAFTSSVTGLSLPNAAGGTVWLLSPTDELHETSYDPNLEDDVSWSFIDTGWQPTYMPSPGAQNIPLAVKPCQPGQERSAITGSCQAIQVSSISSLAPCKPGQERNPATNRCKAVVVASTMFTPCKEGQERNPETNRCRAVLSVASVAGCPEGQERNPATNRCRKVQNGGQNTLASVKDVRSESASQTPQWWIAIGVVCLALGYALYEWRNDLRAGYIHLKEKFISQ